MATPAATPIPLAAQAPRLPTMAAATTPVPLMVAGEAGDRTLPDRPTPAAEAIPHRTLPALREVLLRTLQAAAAVAAEVFPARVVRLLRRVLRVPAVGAGGGRSKGAFLYNVVVRGQQRKQSAADRSAMELSP